MDKLNKLNIDNLIMDEVLVSDDACTLNIHGFPGPGAREDVYSKDHLDYYIRTAVTLSGQSFYYLYYSGVCGSSGEFSFLNSLEDGEKAINYLLKKYPQVNLICQSWGAIVGAHLLKKFGDKIGDVCLITPYCFLPDRERVKEILHRSASFVPHILLKENLEYFEEEIEEVRDKHSFIENISKMMDKEMTIIAAKNSQLVPIQILRETSRILKNRTLHELDQGHDFENKDEFFKIIQKVLKSN